MISKKKLTGLFICPLLALSGLLFWQVNRQIDIIAVHQNNNYSDILVKGFPLTAKGKIEWWIKNKNLLLAKYKIPQPSSYGSYTVTVWEFGEGYMEEGKEDRLCFENMHTEKKCIDKNKLITINSDNKNGVSYSLEDGTYYVKNTGQIEKAAK